MPILDLIFGKRKTPAEVLRENKRMLDRAIRELDRERNAMQTQEKKLIAEIKQMAGKGQNDACKIMAKQLVRNRRAIQKFYQLKSHLQAVSLKITAAKSMDSMAHAMAGATKAMGAMNRQFNLPALRGIMMEFEKQNNKMEQTQDMMDDVFDDEGAEEESDEIVKQVLDELSINLTMQLGSVPQAAADTGPQKEAVAEGMGGAGKPTGGSKPSGGDGGGGGGLSSDLQARLDNLRKG